MFAILEAITVHLPGFMQTSLGPVARLWPEAVIQVLKVGPLRPNTLEAQ